MRFHCTAVILLVLAGTGASAAAAPPSAAPPTADTRLDALVRRHIERRAAASPEWATRVGLHSADDRLDPRDAASFARDSARVDAELRELMAIDTTRLSGRGRVDWLLFRAALETTLHDAGMRGWQRRPAAYIPFDAVYALAVGTEPGPGARARSIVARLEGWPAAMALGRAQLVPGRTPRSWVELDAGSAAGIARWLRDDLPRAMDSLRAQGARVDPARLERARRRALAAVEGYRAWMRDTLAPRASGEWAVGRERYDWRLRHSKLLDTDADSLVALGFRVLHETQGELATLARAIDPARSWRQLADSAKTRHPHRDSIFAAYGAEAARARRFIEARGLFTLPPDERLEMILTPPHLRQTYAYGGYSPAAPFEKRKVGRFFVTPIEAGWSEERIESKLRGHNDGWITVVAVHEGYPGHHLQYVRAATQPNVLRRIHGSEVFGEGWGLYAEEVMYRAGFFPDSLARLTQLRMRLWRAARVIIDPSIHTGRMTFDEAVRFFVDTVGLEAADARAEVTRYTTWPTQAVSYILGMRAIEALRDEARATLGDRFDLARFHDALLAEGSLPPVLMRRAVLAAIQDRGRGHGQGQGREAAPGAAPGRRAP